MVNTVECFYVARVYTLSDHWHFKCKGRAACQIIKQHQKIHFLTQIRRDPRLTSFTWQELSKTDNLTVTPTLRSDWPYLSRSLFLHTTNSITFHVYKCNTMNAFKERLSKSVSPYSHLNYSLCWDYKHRKDTEILYCRETSRLLWCSRTTLWRYDPLSFCLIDLRHTEPLNSACDSFEHDKVLFNKWWHIAIVVKQFGD